MTDDDIDMIEDDFDMMEDELDNKKIANVRGHY